jgi:hypothetical protein
MKVCRDSVTGHDFLKLTKTWQTLEKVLICGTSREQAEALTHSREILICARCGEVLDPLKDID